MFEFETASAKNALFDFLVTLLLKMEGIDFLKTLLLNITIIKVWITLHDTMWSVVNPPCSTSRRNLETTRLTNPKRKRDSEINSQYIYDTKDNYK